MSELDYLLSVHRRDRRRAEAIFDVLSIAVAGLVVGVFYLCGVL